MCIRDSPCQVVNNLFLQQIWERDRIAHAFLFVATVWFFGPVKEQRRHLLASSWGVAWKPPSNGWVGEVCIREVFLHVLAQECLVGPPQVLVLHLGGNDLELLMGKALIIQARLDFERIWEVWPFTWIVWSNMLP